MKFLLRLQRFGFDVSTLQSTDLRLWSDRRSILLFLLAKLCGGENIMHELLDTASKEFQLDDETTRVAKALLRLFSVFQLDHLSLDTLLGVNSECNLFLESTLGLVEIMEESSSSEMEMSSSKHKIEMSRLDGFISNYSLLESTISRFKDLGKGEIDIFPANLKTEAVAFKEDVEPHLEQCFVSVLSKLDDTRRAFSQIHVSPEDAKSLLDKYADEKDHSQNLQGFTIRLTRFKEECNRYIEEFLNCFKVKGDGTKGIGYQSKAIIDQYHQVVKMAELLNKTTVTLNRLTNRHQGERSSEIQAFFGDQETQTPTIKPRRRHQ